MIAIVKNVEFNVGKVNGAGKSYSVTELTVTPEGKTDIKTYPIFTNVPYHNLLTQLKPGDAVELTFVQNGRFKNLGDVKLAQTRGSNSTPPFDGGTTSKAGASSDPSTKDVAIARAVALKAGVEVFNGMLSAGMLKKTLKPDAAVEEIFAITKQFEGYCTLQTDLDALTSNAESIVPRAVAGYEESELPD